jgi:hypothetical protein
VFDPDDPHVVIPDTDTWRLAYQDAYNYLHGGPLNLLPVPYPHQQFPV